MSNPCSARASVVAVVVTYHPDMALLPQVLASVQDQVDAVVVVDNGTTGSALAAWMGRWQAAGRCWIANPDNRGIASAINQGIAVAAAQGGSHVLIMDQDSTLQPGMVASLLAASHAESGNQPPLAAVGPVFVDRRTGLPAPFVRIGWMFNRKLHVQAGQRRQCDFLISSGSLISMAALQVIGGMDEALFIDNVDLEWSFRASAAGYRLMGVGDARMEHAIGDQVFRVPVHSGQLAFSLHGPRRLYYMTRNRLTLYARPSTPWPWITQDLPRVVLKFIGMSLMVAPRWRNCRAMVLGMVDALRGRLGVCRHRT